MSDAYNLSTCDSDMRSGNGNEHVFTTGAIINSNKRAKAYTFVVACTNSTGALCTWYWWSITENKPINLSKYIPPYSEK